MAKEEWLPALVGVGLPLLWASYLIIPLWWQRHQSRRRTRRKNSYATEGSLLHTKFKTGGSE